MGLRIFLIMYIIFNWITNKLMYQYFFVFEMSRPTKFESIARWVIPFYDYMCASYSLGVSTVFMSLCLVLITVGFGFSPMMFTLLDVTLTAEVARACSWLCKVGLVGLLLNWFYLEMKVISSLRLSLALCFVFCVCPMVVDLRLIQIMRRKIKER